MSEENKQYDPELVKEVREQVLAELKEEEARKKALEEKARQEEMQRRDEYLERMKESKTPWVELMGITEKDGRIKIELEWNDAFVAQLRQAGYNGSEDRIMQQYIAELAYDVSEDMKNDLGVDKGEEVKSQ